MGALLVSLAICGCGTTSIGPSQYDQRLSSLQSWIRDAYEHRLDEQGDTIRQIQYLAMYGVEVPKPFMGPAKTEGTLTDASHDSQGSYCIVMGPNAVEKADSVAVGELITWYSGRSTWNIYVAAWDAGETRWVIAYSSIAMPPGEKP